MDAPIVSVQTIELVPGFKIKHVLDVDLEQTQYAEFRDQVKTALIDFMNEDGRFGNLDEGEYVVRFKPLEVEVLVK